MNKFLKALIISLVIFVIHLIAFSTTNYFTSKNFGYYGLLGGAVYAFIFGFWVYYILSLAYLYITKSKLTALVKLIYAFVIVVIGYFMARVSYIIDGDFVRKFDILLLLTFLLSSILLVVLDRVVDGRKKLT